MSKQSTVASEVWRCWSNLPFDILIDISRRVHAPTDYVRFLAVCKSWRDTLPAASCRPSLLPWLLSRRDNTGKCKACCVFSSRSTSCATVNGVYIPGVGWAITADDGAAACCRVTNETKNGLDDDPFAGLFASPAASSIALPPYPDRMKSWVKGSSGTVSGDGTMFLYALDVVQRPAYFAVPIFVALHRPGDPHWTLIERNGPMVSCNYLDTWCIAYHGPKIVLCNESSWWGNSWTIMSTDVDGGRTSGRIDGNDSAGKKLQSSYFAESRGELLWVFVHVNKSSVYYKNYSKHRAGDLESLPKALILSVFVLRYEAGEPQ